MRIPLTACGIALMAMVSPAAAITPNLPQNNDAVLPARNGLSNATILIVRHAEKPAQGTGLSPAGVMRADVYARYFQRFDLADRPAHIDELVAAADTDKSSRPRLTLEPLSLETGMAINQPCSERAVHALKAWLQQRPPHQTTLVAWHHTQIAKLLTVLGADPAALLPNGRWPDDAFDWVIALRFDEAGHLIPGSARLIQEPRAVDDVVWSVMDHPTIRPMAPAEMPVPLPAEVQAQRQVSDGELLAAR